VNRPNLSTGRRATFHSPNPSADPVGSQWEKERVTQVHTPPEVRKAATELPRFGRRLGSRELRYRTAAATAVLAALGMLVSTGGVALAAPKPTVAEVQHKLTELNTKVDRLDQQLDQAEQELSSATQRLKVVNREGARYEAQFKSMRAQIGQIAAQAYEQGSLNSSMALLTSGDPQQILNQSSILLELSSANNAEMSQFLAAARQLTSTQQAAQRTRAGILALKRSLSARKKALNKLISQQTALLNQLTPAQQTGTGPGGSGGGGTTGGHDPLPTSGQAGKAVAYVYSVLGCPYLYGGTGPCHPGYDCSGLMMEAWAYAGISIPRVSYDQMSDLPSVSLDDLQPGDILGFAGNSHVGMYVGDGELIDAPQTGMDIEKVPLSGWYKEELDGAVRP
jgi:peptidoglycan DL-endopeptidase CwlO